jgi:hypothetical protein
MVHIAEKCENLLAIKGFYRDYVLTKDYLKFQVDPLRIIDRSPVVVLTVRVSLIFIEVVCVQ